MDDRLILVEDIAGDRVCRASGKSYEKSPAGITWLITSQLQSPTGWNIPLRAMHYEVYNAYSHRMEIGEDKSGSANT